MLFFVFGKCEGQILVVDSVNACHVGTTLNPSSHDKASPCRIRTSSPQRLLMHPCDIMRGLLGLVLGLRLGLGLGSGLGLGVRG
jgi:hypothetical protein